jgi:DNA helicase-2/ATP-dependent DNA helicase PcrA
VFIAGLEDGLFPHSRSATDPAQLEEERRLCYVAMTRAERFLYVTHAMKRRVYGEELASEPSQFLNEMPLELMEDLSRGNSWLSFARGSTQIDYEHGEYRRGQAAGAGDDQSGHRKEKGKYAGKTYDSVDSIAEFFKQRATQLGNTSGSFTRQVQSPKSKVQSPKPGSRSSKLETRNSKLETPPSAADFVPGSYVRHAKYGRGLVLRREGVGDSLKLTVTFPGYGQKKLIEKYAGLERA